MSGSEAFKEPSVKLILDHFKINKWEFGVGGGDRISFSLFYFGRELLFPRGFLLSSRAVIVKFPSELYLSELPLLSLLFSVIQTTYSFIHLSYFSVQCLGCIILKTFLGNERTDANEFSTWPFPPNCHSICLLKMDWTKFNSLAMSPLHFYLPWREEK